MIDGSPVKIGDSVYVLGIGYGTVSSISDDGGFSVKTGTGEAFYRDGGYIGNQRRVYWADPIIINPPRDARIWRVFCNMAITLYKQLENMISYFNGGSNDKPLE